MTVIRWGFKAPAAGGLLPAGRTISFSLAKPVVARPADDLPYTLVTGDDDPIVVSTDGNGRGEVNLPSLPIDTAYMVAVEGGGIWYIQPLGLGPVNLEDLPSIDPATLEPTVDTIPAWEAAVAATQAAAASAQGSKVLAQAAMDSADSSARTAAARATDAGNSATAAGTSAGAASGSATAAGQSATNAGTSATAAATARTGAETARTGAETAQGAAQTARTGAETARTGAETAQAAAETARTGSQTAQTAAETARDAALAVTLGAALSTVVDIDTYRTPGRWRVQAGASASNGLPLAAAGVLDVFNITGTNNATQEFTPFGGSATARKGFYRRTANNTATAWDPWQFFPSQRIDNPADQPGLAMYTWDNTGARELQVMIGAITLTGDLNLVTYPGTYRQPSQGGATLVNNYPTVSRGILEVHSIDGVGGVNGEIIQTYRPVAPSAASSNYWGDYTRRRNYAASTWSAWRFRPSQRIDNPASQPGVGVATWDDVNNREQLLLPTNISLGTTDLNAVNYPGQYYQTSATNGSLANNYPIAGFIGVVEVIPGSTTALQRATPTATGGIFTRGFWSRRYRYSDTSWSAWVFIASQRVDQTAGRAIYTWDDQNNREQLVWGDTGWRDVSALLLNGWTGSLYLRRSGSTVEFIGVQLDRSAATAVQIYQAPVGFIPKIQLPVFARPAVDTAAPIPGSVSITGFLALVAGTALINNTSLQIAFSTVDPWPTALPGVAFGGIQST